MQLNRIKVKQAAGECWSDGGGVLSQILGMSFEAAESLRAPVEKQ